MLPSVEAWYHDGKIEMREKPEGIREARIIITFVEISKDSELESEKIKTRMRAVENLRSMLGDVHPQHCLSDELIAQRRQEARNE